MAHFVCKGSCAGSLKDLGVCESEGCSHQWGLMEACDCADGKHFLNSLSDAVESKGVTKDSHGTLLQSGDDVVLIKDLTLRGTSRVLKRGTKATNIQLTDNPDEVDCRLDGTAIVLRAEFLKKV